MAFARPLDAATSDGSVVLRGGRHTRPARSLRDADPGSARTPRPRPGLVGRAAGQSVMTSAQKVPKRVFGALAAAMPMRRTGRYRRLASWAGERCQPPSARANDG